MPRLLIFQQRNNISIAILASFTSDLAQKMLEPPEFAPYFQEKLAPRQNLTYFRARYGDINFFSMAILAE